uniref:Protein kinase domain-containing protein n=1 Tax=Panagrellus redivivus TaxID=6233 RepID=A0A7E4V6Y6_PANRE
MDNGTITGTEGTVGSALGGVGVEARLVVKPGYQIKDWTVLDVIGGGFGDVYKVRDVKSNEMGAMKVESGKTMTYSMLAREAKIYKALAQHRLTARHVATMIAYEKATSDRASVSFLVVEFLGPSLRDLRASADKFELSTVLRVGIQTLLGIKCLHDVGYVHRHLKPSCFMLGPGTDADRCRMFFLTDFQLARRFVHKTKNNIGIFREERDPGSIKMCGYLRYVSVSVHNGNEHRCRDDLWSWLYILAELTQRLPWQNVRVDPTYVHALKMVTPDAQLFAKGKDSTNKTFLLNIPEYLRTLHANSKPDYFGIYRRLRNAMNAIGVKWGDPYDWETGGNLTDPFPIDSEFQRYFVHEEFQIVRKGDGKVDQENSLKDDSSPRPTRRASFTRKDASESVELVSFIDVDVTQNSLDTTPTMKTPRKKRDDPDQTPTPPPTPQSGTPKKRRTARDPGKRADKDREEKLKEATSEFMAPTNKGDDKRRGEKGSETLVNKSTKVATAGAGSSGIDASTRRKRVPTPVGGGSSGGKTGGNKKDDSVKTTKRGKRRKGGFCLTVNDQTVEKTRENTRETTSDRESSDESHKGPVKNHSAVPLSGITKVPRSPKRIIRSSNNNKDKEKVVKVSHKKSKSKDVGMRRKPSRK